MLSNGNSLASKVTMCPSTQSHSMRLENILWFPYSYHKHASLIGHTHFFDRDTKMKLNYRINFYWRRNQCFHCNKKNTHVITLTLKSLPWFDRADKVWFFKTSVETMNSDMLAIAWKYAVLKPSGLRLLSVIENMPSFHWYCKPATSKSPRMGS